MPQATTKNANDARVSVGQSLCASAGETRVAHLLDSARALTPLRRAKETEFATTFDSKGTFVYNFVLADVLFLNET